MLRSYEKLGLAALGWIVLTSGAAAQSETNGRYVPSGDVWIFSDEIASYLPRVVQRSAGPEVPTGDVWATPDITAAQTSASPLPDTSAVNRVMTGSVK